MTDSIFSRLKAPFPPDRVSWRVGSTTGDKKKGLALAYIDARDVMDRLDDVVGPAGWQCQYPHANGKTVCSIGILASDQWIWKADGAGDTDVEAEKGALSDAFKRAAVRWGIGRYLYDVASPWVELEPAGRSFKIKDSELPKLRKLLGGTAQHKVPAEQLDTDYRAEADDLIEQVRACQSEDDIAAVGKRTRPIYDALPQSEQTRVYQAGQERRVFLRAKRDKAA